MEAMQVTVAEYIDVTVVHVAVAVVIAVNLAAEVVIAVLVE